MKNYYQTLLQQIENTLDFEPKKPVIVYLEAGHFNPAYGADDFAKNSLSDAIQFGTKLIQQYGKKIRIVFGILIDDLGLQCGSDVCEINAKPADTDNTLPQEIESILATSKLIKRDRLLLFSEKTTKNRAINRLKKRLTIGDSSIRVLTPSDDGKSKIMMKLNETGEEILLSNKLDHVFGIKCPGIMGQHYDDVLSKLKERFFESSVFHIIDWSEIMDETKVTHGARAFTNVFNTYASPNVLSASVTNIFYIDDEGLLSKLNHEAAITSPDSHITSIA